MNREISVRYTGHCPLCGVFEESNHPENVDIMYLMCEAEKGKIQYIRNIKGYEYMNTIEISIETPDKIITIKEFNPEIMVKKK